MSAMTDSSPTPPTDPAPLPLITLDARPFWDGCREHRLLLQYCESCARYQFYPRDACTACGGPVTFVPASGKGRVYSFSVCHRPLTPRFGPELYVVALVDLAEGPRMMTNVVDCAPSEVRIGMPVSVRFRRLTDEVTLPVFGPEEGA